MDAYIESLIRNVKTSYSDYRSAMKDYLVRSYIDDAGELIYPVAIAARVIDEKEKFEEAYKNLQIAKSIMDFEG